MEPGASSLLMQCLAQLGQDTVAQVLLPKLLEQGSGPALAATCSQLRVLMHSSITRLVLKSFWQAGNPGLTKAWTARLPDHFPSCNDVCLQGLFPAANHSMPYVISALARLPNLDAISIKATFTEPFMLALSTVLYCLRVQLTGLKSLTLELQDCDATGVGCTWQELGRATQLTALDVNLMWPMQEDPQIYIKDAAALSALQRLLVLRVTDECTDEEQSVDWSFASCLTALTELAIAPACRAEGRAAVGSCTALCDLTLYSAGDPQLPAALAQLTGLTRLHLDGQVVRPDSECAQALGCLKHLRWLGARKWTPRLLRVLQGLPQLSVISGGWMPAAALLGSVHLPQVCELLNAGGSAPLEAFPHLVSAQLCDTYPAYPSVLPKLATCCPQLQELQLGSYYAFADTTAVIKGLQSLAGLQHLQRLQLQVHDEAQLAAAASACMVLGQCSLKMLHVSVSGCRFSSLVVLSKLARLDVLHVVFSPPVVWCSVSRMYKQESQQAVRVEDAGLLLWGLSAVRKVIISVRDKEVLAALRAAPPWAAGRGLPVACEVDVVVR